MLPLQKLQDKRPAEPSAKRPMGEQKTFLFVLGAMYMLKGGSSMSKIHIIVFSGVMLAAGGAFAQSSTVTGAAGGAVTGAVVGGPIGAAVGGVVGAVAGTAIDPPPPRVVTYVRQAPMPTEPVIVSEKVVVGEALPSAVVVHEIPDNPKYSYAVVNQQRVIVEPSSRKVVQVIN